MTAIVTTPFRVVNAENFKEDIAGSSVYVGIGKSDVWSTATSDLTDATTPFTPSDRIDDIHEAYQNLIGMKKIASADVAHIVPRHTWTSGTTYTAWDSDDSAIYDKAFYIVTSEYKVYKCIHSPGTQSLIEPTHINTDPTAESDTYKWKYMYTVTVTDSEKFLTISYMPVRTEQPVSTSIGGNGGSSSTTVTLTAANEYIVVGMLVTGSGITAGDTVAGIDGVTLTLSTARAVANSTTLTFGRLGTTDVNFANQTAQINSADTSLTAVAGIERYEVTAPGSGYTSAPDVIVRGDGTNALAIATVSGGEITAISVSSAGSGLEANKGDNYTVADLLIGSVSAGGGTGGAGRAVIATQGGHGIDPVKELGAFYVAVNSQLSGSEGGDLTVGNDFRQISLIKKPQNYGTDVTATATTLRARKSLVLAAGQSVSGFAVDQVIVGGTSGAKAYLVEIDTTNKVLYYYQNSKTGYEPFVQGDAITGTLPSGGSATLHQGSGTSWYGQSTNGYGPEVKLNSGQLLFLENRAPINRSSSQIEDIKLIIEF